MNGKDINVVGGAALAAVAMIALTVLSAAAVAFFWRQVMPSVFGLKELTFGEAFSLVALLWVIQFPKL